MDRETSPYEPYYIGAAGTYQVYTGACTLHVVALTVGTTAGTIDIIDGTSDSTPNIMHIPVGTYGNQFEVCVRCSKGIRVITSSNSDYLLLSYRAG
jgi:hypothetical protein